MKSGDGTQSWLSLKGGDNYEYKVTMYTISSD